MDMTKYAVLGRALSAARKSAMKTKVVKGGACNFDKLLVRSDSLNSKQIAEIAGESGVNTTTKFWLGKKWTSLSLGRGQGNLNTAPLEAAKKSIDSLGLDWIETAMFYQID